MRGLLTILICLVVGSSCSTKIVSNNYYQKNKSILDSIELTYQQLSSQKPFAIAFGDKNFNIATVDIISDTLTRIYDFDVRKDNLKDTLLSYGYDAKTIIQVMEQMRAIKVAWITSFDYYVNDQPRQMIYLSVKPQTIRYPFSPPKYITLAYFRGPQNFDEKGRLLDGRRTNRLRKLNGQVFYKISNRICYTIASKFR